MIADSVFLYVVGFAYVCLFCGSIYCLRLLVLGVFDLLASLLGYVDLFCLCLLFWVDSFVVFIAYYCGFLSLG